MRIVSYPPQGYGPQGYQPYGPPPPGYGPYGYGPPSPALAYITAVAFLVSGAFELMLAITNWSGDGDNAQMALALVGAAFTEDATGNVDFAISATMTVACSTLTFALVMFARLQVIRWVLVVIGGITTLYYLYGIIWIVSNDAGEYVAVTLVTWLLWLAATVIAALPATGRAMRGRNRPAFPQPGYPPRY